MEKKQIPLIGAHTSAAGGVANALYRARDIGANITQLFTANQRQWRHKDLHEQLIHDFHLAKEKTGIELAISHASYLINLCSDQEEVVQKSVLALKQEILRCQSLGVQYLNFHPGSSKEKPLEEALDLIVEGLCSLKSYLDDGRVTLLLETTAGQGSQLGWKLQHHNYLIERLAKHVPIGVCVDTCHSFAAGYKLVTKSDWQSFIDEFDRIVGIKYLEFLHLNDSVKACGERVDRHAALGEGKMGWAVFEATMTDFRTKNIPKILETPKGEEVWKQEIAHLKKIYYST